MAELESNVGSARQRSPGPRFRARRDHRVPDRPDPRGGRPRAAARHPGLRAHRALCGHIADGALTVGALAAATALLIAARIGHPDRTGVTTELAAPATFLIGYLCLTKTMPFGAALGIVIAVTLEAKSPLHRFALKTTS